MSLQDEIKLINKQCEQIRELREDINEAFKGLN